MPLYFAYGSNMDRGAMTARCPSSRPLGPARLARHRLVVMREGFASVTRDPRRAVLGLLWDLALADVPALDRYEGVARGLYAKRHLPVATAGGARRALVYLGSNPGPGSPRPGYLENVLAAARAAGLPAAYLAEIAALGARLPGRRGEGLEPWVPGWDIASVRPTRATPRDRPRAESAAGWSWEP